MLKSLDVGVIKYRYKEAWKCKTLLPLFLKHKDPTTECDSYCKNFDQTVHGEMTPRFIRWVTYQRSDSSTTMTRGNLQESTVPEYEYEPVFTAE